MAKMILQINAHANIPRSDMEEEFKGAAVPIASVPGLDWKMFGIDAERSEVAGIYLFEDAQALETYMQGPIMEAMRSKPAFAGIEVKVFEVSEEATVMTRGPI